MLMIEERANEDDSAKDPQLRAHLQCMHTRFCSGIMFEVVLGSARNIEYLREHKTCESNFLSCAKLFTTEQSHYLKFPHLISPAGNYSFLVSQLSSCEKNVVFIHNRLEMHKIVKPKLPKLASHHRREFKYTPLPDDTLQGGVFACRLDVEHMIKSLLGKYFEHGLYLSWTNLASRLMFHWSTGTNEHAATATDNSVILDKKFAYIIFAGCVVHIFAISMMLLECTFYFWNDASVTKFSFSIRFSNLFSELKKFVRDAHRFLKILVVVKIMCIRKIAVESLKIAKNCYTKLCP